MPAEQRVWIATDRDIVSARKDGRAMALELGFSQGDATVISAAISEIARNMLDYAGGGEVTLSVVTSAERRGIEVIGSDDGPGIPDVSLAMFDGFSTAGNLGLGLPGSRRLMDEFEIKSDPGVGTTITMRKWRR